MFSLILVPKDTNRGWSGDQTWGPLLWGAEGCKAIYCATDTGPHLLRFFEGQGQELKAAEVAQVRRCLLLKGI